MFHLAQTVWPRFGGDQANSSLLSIRGPHTTPTWQKISLSSHHSVRPRDKESISGVIVMPDETLRVCHMGMLSAVSLDGTILWQLDLAGLVPEDDGLYYSLPTALQTGETLMVLPDALLIVNKLGDIHRKEHWLAPDKTGEVLATIAAPDDSGFSPNLTYNGLPVLSAIMGDVYVFKQNLWHEIGVYGLDVVTPAIYPDNSLAIAGYAGTGFCRVSLDGTTQWTTQVKMADKLPTINREHIAAIGSDDGFSAFFRSNGELIGEYKRSATFAEYIDGGWIALSRRRLARLTQDGFASDQYALGIMTYEWISGTTPFQGSTTEVCTQHLCTQPPSLHEKIPTLTPGVEKVIFKHSPKNQISVIRTFKPWYRHSPVLSAFHIYQRNNKPAQQIFIHKQLSTHPAQLHG